MLSLKQISKAGVYIYIHLYIYVCVCVCVYVCLQTQEAQNVECRTLSSGPEIEAHVVCLRASPVNQRIKCLPAMQEISVRSLGQEDLLQKKMATQSSIPAWRPMDGGTWWATVHEVAKSRT